MKMVLSVMILAMISSSHCLATTNCILKTSKQKKVGGGEQFRIKIFHVYFGWNFEYVFSLNPYVETSRGLDGYVEERTKAFEMITEITNKCEGQVEEITSEISDFFGLEETVSSIELKFR